MLPSFKRFLWIALLAGGLQTSWAFSLIGPNAAGSPNGADSYQVTLIGYNPLTGLGPPGLVDGLLVGPKNLGEGYRRNTPVMYYSFNANFLNYFDTNGAGAVDKAYAILNNTFTNNPTGLTNGLDGYSADLSEFPLQSETVNYEAQALGLRDIKSTTLALMMEQLGLADSVRYTWVLHDRFQPSGTTCPNGTLYTVAMRNFSITPSPVTQVQYSPYVNGTLLDYYILENCGAAGVSPPDADALEVPVDALMNNPPVASGQGVDALRPGSFYTGLTRDDVGGLRYLLRSNNIDTEASAAGSLLITTNISSPVVINTLPLSLLTQVQSIDPFTLLTLPTFANLVISSVSTNFAFVPATNVTTFLQNPPVGSPAGTPPTQVTVTNVSGFTLVTNYTYTFANIVTNSSTTNTTIITQTISTGNLIGAPAGSPPIINKVTSTTTHTHDLNGDFFIVPASWCGFITLTSSVPRATFFTNTTSISGTNQLGVAQFSTLTITSFTNRTLVIEPEICTTANSTPQLRPGIERLQFVRANFDSLLGQTFQPITNNYTTFAVTGGQLVAQRFQRVVTVPDFLFSAADLAPGPSVGPADFPTAFGRNINFDTANAGPGLAGPGVINSPTTFTLNKNGPLFENVGTSFLTGNNFDAQDFIWASFDETTNAPIVYPNGLSIGGLENQILIQISPTPPNLTAGTNGVPYATTFTAAGGSFSPPYTWSLAPGSGPLPSGLSLSTVTNGSDGNDGRISGTPTQAGTFDFVLQLTDSLGRTVQWSYSITIN